MDEREVRERLNDSANSFRFGLDGSERIVRRTRTRLLLTQAIPAMLAVGAIVIAASVFMGQEGGDTLRPQPAGDPSGPFLLDLRTGERTPLAENLAGGQSYVPSPDGERLAYGTCCSAVDQVTVVNIDGTDARTLESPEGLNYYGPRWSPDGTKLVYQERDGGGDTALTGDVGNLFVEDLASGRRTQITDLELSRAWWWFLSPSFSPDGRNVIFHLPRGRSETTKWDAWSVPVTGGEPTLILRNASFPIMGVHRPNGVEIAFVSPGSNDFAGRSIVTARLLSPPESDIHETLVKAKYSIDFPTPSPDGGRIAYQDGGSIYVVDYSVSGVAPESSKVADGLTAEWLDNHTLIVSPQ
jgi:Tol biopolymer transport system component